MVFTLGVGPVNAIDTNAGTATVSVVLSGTTPGRSIVVGLRWWHLGQTVSSVSCSGESNLTLHGSPIYDAASNIALQFASLGNNISGGDKTITLTLTGNILYKGIFALEVAGGDLAAFFNAEHGLSGSGVNPTDSVTTTTNNCLIVAQIGGGSFARSAGSGYTGYALTALTNAGEFSEYKLDAGAAGPISASFTDANSQAWVIKVAAFNSDTTGHAVFNLPVTTLSALGGPLGAIFNLPIRTLAAGNQGAEFNLPVITLVAVGVEVQAFIESVSLPLPTESSAFAANVEWSESVLLPLPSEESALISQGLYVETLAAPLPQEVSAFLNGNVFSESIILPVPVDASAFGTYQYSESVTLPMPFEDMRLESAITQTYRGWPVNLKNMGLTEYDNFAFNSMTRFNGEYLAAGTNGLFAMTGTTDNGVAIDARIRFGMTNFGSEKLKRIEDAFLEYRSAGDLLFRIIIDGGETYEYTVSATGNTGMAKNRAKIGKAIESNFWTLEIENIDGTAFDLQSISIRPVILSRKIGRPAVPKIYTERLRAPRPIESSVLQ